MQMMQTEKEQARANERVTDRTYALGVRVNPDL